MHIVRDAIKVLQELKSMLKYLDYFGFIMPLKWVNFPPIIPESECICVCVLLNFKYLSTHLFTCGNRVWLWNPAWPWIHKNSPASSKYIQKLQEGATSLLSKHLHSSLPIYIPSFLSPFCHLLLLSPVASILWPTLIYSFKITNKI